MSSHPEFSYSHHGLVFYPLEVPEIAERIHLVNNKDNESSRYLHARAQGFVVLHWIQPPRVNEPRFASVGIFASVDYPHELVIVKKLPEISRRVQASNRDFPMPAEVEQSSLSDKDADVARQLPLYHENMGLTPFPQLHAFQVHKRTIGRQLTTPDEDVTLFYKYYNGGTLRNLIKKYADAGRRVPEGFIWHVLAQLCRAVSWLHTGHIPSRDDNLGRGDASNPPKTAPDKWEPICHQDMHADNIFLHFPTDEEKEADPRLEQFTDYLPQVIVADFGLSFQAKNDRSQELGVDPNNPYLPEHSTWKDKADIGEAILRLLVPDYSPTESDITIFHHAGFLDPRFCGTHPEEQMGDYSKELVECWSQFEPLVLLILKPDEWLQGVESSDGSHWKTWPTNEAVFGTTIAMADRHVEAYINSDNKESLRWTQTFKSLMPYHSVPRNPKHRRSDWATVDKHLNDTIKETLIHFSPGCVKIRQVHIMGKGSVEKELDEVNPELARQTDDESTSDEEPDSASRLAQARRATTVRQPRRHGTGVQRRRRARVGQPTRPVQRDSSPPVDEEYRWREWVMARDYERRCRERGLW
ncbi:uncharacterized protein B0H64DRAFT_356156 [Chaetomium fimeti]|uniref:non-specific serine/threonine protein kinase n=1 Tax=Chaetomium fimeti TaxID=1854472 RepID=A0AAE0HHG0_9PEZI|nr:hypothetical protein B0H64DRAFT_356156 [Chaetomium fimeti]